MLFEVCLLGTGGPDPLPERLGPALLLSFQHQHLVIDTGRGVTTRLVQAGVAPHEVNAILLTHHHADHIAGLGDLLITAWHGGATLLPVIGPPGTHRIVHAFFQTVYQREIAFTYALGRATGETVRPIEDVVHIAEIRAGETLQQGVWKVSAAGVEHGHALGLTVDEWPCLAYSVQAGGKSVAISGDTILCRPLIELARGADLLVQCCFLADAALSTPSHRLMAEVVIATSGQVGKIAARADVKKLVLTHLSPMPPELLAAMVADVRRDYSGALVLGEDLLRLTV